MAAIGKYQLQRPIVYADFDHEADVLYIVLGTPVPSEGVGVSNGLELDYSLSEGLPCAVTVIGYELYDWPTRLPSLAETVATHLGVSEQVVAAAIHRSLISYNIPGGS